MNAFEWQPLKYSERLKPLKSFIKDKPLLSKVVEWLRFKSLALLAVSRKSLALLAVFGINDCLCTVRQFDRTGDSFKCSPTSDGPTAPSVKLDSFQHAAPPRMDPRHRP